MCGNNNNNNINNEYCILYTVYSRITGTGPCVARSSQCAVQLKKITHILVLVTSITDPPLEGPFIMRVVCSKYGKQK